MIIITFYFAYVFIATIHLYRICLRPFVTASCCMHPNCSEYGLLAVQKHGPFKGGYLAVRRIMRCRPGQERLIDFVP